MSLVIRTQRCMPTPNLNILSFVIFSSLDKPLQKCERWRDATEHEGGKIWKERSPVYLIFTNTEQNSNQGNGKRQKEKRDEVRTESHLLTGKNLRDRFYWDFLSSVMKNNIFNKHKHNRWANHCPQCVRVFVCIS